MISTKKYFESGMSQLSEQLPELFIYDLLLYKQAEQQIFH